MYMYMYMYMYVHAGHLKGLYVSICSSISIELEVDEFLGSCMVLLKSCIYIFEN